MDTNAGLAGKDGRDQWGNFSFSNLFTVTGADGQATGTAYQKKTASYKLSEMYDANGKDTGTPYFDVIVFSTASIVSGADAQNENALRYTWAWTRSGPKPMPTRSSQTTETSYCARAS